MLSSPNYTEKPIKLVSFDSLGHVILHQEALVYIQSLPKPLSVCSICGPYRTGKSYLLNQIIGPKEALFEVGITTQSCSKGLWIWGKPILTTNDKSQIVNVILIDTEGFGVIDEQNDPRIITLALLLSNAFIYNSKGMIDQDAFTQLQFILKIVNDFQANDHWNTDFHWVLRDFYLQLTNQIGNPISSQEYLNKNLAEFTSINLHSKKTLYNYFRSRSCHNFVSPFDQNQEEKPQFTQQVLKFKKIFSSFPQMNYDGQLLAEILQAYISGMNDKCSNYQIFRMGKQCIVRRECMQKFYHNLSKLSFSSNQSVHRIEKKIEQILEAITSQYQTKTNHFQNMEALESCIQEIREEFLKNLKRPPSKPKKTHRDTLKISRKEVRTSINTIGDSYGSQNYMQSSQRIETMTHLKLREQLEGKVHRYELEIHSLTEYNERIEKDLLKAEQERDQYQEKIQSLQQNNFISNKNFLSEKIALQAQKQKIRQEKLVFQSQLLTLKQLYQQKVEFLQEKLVEYEIGQKQNQQSLIRKYLIQIEYLNRENKEMHERHEQQINFIKNLYRQCIFSSAKDDIQDSSPVPEKIKLQVQKTVDMIEELKDKNYQYQRTLNTKEEQIRILSQQLLNLKNHLQDQLFNQEKRSKENQQHLKQIFYEQFKVKEALIEQLRLKADQLLKEKQNYDQLYSEKYARHEEEMDEIVKDYEEKLEEAKKQQFQNSLKLQQIQELLEEKQQQNKKFQEEIFKIRNFLTGKAEREMELEGKLSEQKEKEDFRILQCEQQNKKLKLNIQDLKEELELLQNKYHQQKQELKKLHQIESFHAEQKIGSLMATISKQALFNSEQEKQRIQQLEDSLQLAYQETKDAQNKCKELENQKKELEQERGNMNVMIDQLNKRMVESQEELKNLIEIKKNESSIRDEKYFDLLNRYHEKEKKLSLLEQAHELAHKRLEDKEKQYSKSYDRQLGRCRKAVEEEREDSRKIAAKMHEKQNQLMKAYQQMSLLEQKCNYLTETMSRSEELMGKQREKDFKRNDNLLNNMETRLKENEKKSEAYVEKIKRLEKDAEQTAMSLMDMNASHKKHYQQYENNARLLRKRGKELQDENNELKKQLDQLLKELRDIEERKKLVEDNYQSDFQVWARKLRKYEEHVRCLQTK